MQEKKYDFICIDFETANKSMDSACSIGIVAVKDLEIVDKVYYLIKPPNDYFHVENTAIHNLSYSDVKNCEQFPNIWDKIKLYFNYSEFIFAHNAQFDMSVLNSLMDTYAIDKPDFNYIDSINFTTPVCNNVGNSLVDRANHLNIEIVNHHNALEDAIVCAKLIILSIQKSRFKTFYTYLKCYSRIKVKKFSELKANTNLVKWRKTIKISELTAATTEFNTNHPFYQKSCVFTGDLNAIDRKSAMQQVIDLGGFIKTGVTTKTDYVIVGKQDKSVVDESGMSNKEKKAYLLIEQGYNIKILNEFDFIRLLHDK